MAKKSTKATDVLSNPSIASGKYSVTASFNGTSASASADTVSGALLALGITGLKTKVVLRFENSETGKSFERPYLPRQAKRYFTSIPYAGAIGKTITAAIG